MEYNSQRNRLLIPEYGRNIQKMIEHTIQIEDREKRNMMAKAIINVMGQLNPHLRDFTDFKHKLWDHLFIISDFKLDVDSPYPIPSQQTLHVRPQRVPYPSNAIRYRHYGKIIENLIAEVIKQEDGPKKDALVASIANFMKTAYLNWNRDTVSDDVILEQFKELTGGKLKLNENFRLNIAEAVPQQVQRKSNNNFRLRNNNRNRNQGNDRRFNKKK